MSKMLWHLSLHFANSTRRRGKDTIMARATLLFAHGGGFCKETWNPIIRRVRESPLLQSIPTDFETFDFQYHGSRRDESVPPVFNQIGPQSVRVQHPAQELTRWTSAQVLEEVKAIRARKPKPHPLIGIGHSMGASALWNIEVQNPGTFDGLVLFEPMYGTHLPGGGDKIVDFLVSLTLQRESSWPTRAKAIAHFEQLKNFKNWDRESLAAYLDGALVEETNGTIALACHPHIEAAFYCHKALNYEGNEPSRVQCKVTFHYGSRTKMFYPPTFDKILSKWSDTYTLRPPMDNCSHAMVLEKPELSAQRILEDLAQLDTFKLQSKI